MKNIIKSWFFSSNSSEKILCESNFEFDSSPKAWFGTGGKFECVFKPKTEIELEFFLKNIPSDLEIFPVGSASNLLVHDDGFNSGIILRFLKMNHIEFYPEKSEIHCGPGVPDKNLAQFALENSIPGFEFLATIPGNIGGAARMNAGCFGGEIKDILKAAIGLKRNGEKVFLTNEDFGFEYRKTKLKDIFLTNIIFHANQNPNLQNEIFQKMEKFRLSRNLAQPTNVKTGGSTFKNPLNHELKAWQLLDASGLRGFRIGGAHFCQKHTNFIVNDQGASSENIKNLIEEAQEKVLNKFDVILTPEIVFLGFEKKN